MSRNCKDSSLKLIDTDIYLNISESVRRFRHVQEVLKNRFGTILSTDGLMLGGRWDPVFENLFLWAQ